MDLHLKFSFHLLRNTQLPWFLGSHVIFFLVLLKFSYLLLAALGLCCFMRVFSGCVEWRLLFTAVQQASHCSGFSLLSRHMDFSGCGTWASLLFGRWDLPKPGIQPMSSLLAGRFLPTLPLRRSWSFHMRYLNVSFLNLYIQLKTFYSHQIW